MHGEDKKAMTPVVGYPTIIVGRTLAIGYNSVICIKLSEYLSINVVHIYFPLTKSYAVFLLAIFESLFLTSSPSKTWSKHTFLSKYLKQLDFRWFSITVPDHQYFPGTNDEEGSLTVSILYVSTCDIVINTKIKFISLTPAVVQTLPTLQGSAQSCSREMLKTDHLPCLVCWKHTEAFPRKLMQIHSALDVIFCRIHRHQIASWPVVLSESWLLKLLKRKANLQSKTLTR